MNRNAYICNEEGIYFMHITVYLFHINYWAYVLADTMTGGVPISESIFEIESISFRIRIAYDRDNPLAVPSFLADVSGVLIKEGFNVPFIVLNSTHIVQVIL